MAQKGSGASEFLTNLRVPRSTRLRIDRGTLAALFVITPLTLGSLLSNLLVNMACSLRVSACLQELRQAYQILRKHANETSARAVDVGYQKKRDGNSKRQDPKNEIPAGSVSAIAH